MAGVYVPGSPTTGVLYGVVRTHLTDFLASVNARTDANKSKTTLSTCGTSIAVLTKRKRRDASPEDTWCEVDFG